MLIESTGTYPLQVLRAHADPSDGSLSVVVLHLSGGLLDGDEVAIDVRLEPCARVALRTQAALQAHAGRSQQTLRATVADGAWFSYVPHALVPHADADHHAKTVVNKVAGARVLVADALSPGRVEHGEQFAYQRVRLDLDVWCEGDLVARERAVVEPDLALRGAQFGRFTHTAAAYVLGPSAHVFGPSALLLDEAFRSASVGATELARGGWYVRALADRAATLDEVLARLQADWWLAPHLCDLHNCTGARLGDLPVGARTSRRAHLSA